MLFGREEVDDVASLLSGGASSGTTAAKYVPAKKFGTLVGATLAYYANVKKALRPQISQKNVGTLYIAYQMVSLIRYLHPVTTIQTDPTLFKFVFAFLIPWQVPDLTRIVKNCSPPQDFE